MDFLEKGLQGDQDDKRGDPEKGKEVIYLIEGEIIRHRVKQEALQAGEPGKK